MFNNNLIIVIIQKIIQEYITNNFKKFISIQKNTIKIVYSFTFYFFSIKEAKSACYAFCAAEDRFLSSTDEAKNTRSIKHQLL
ncbi:hypothetical protein GCM10023260_14640 [Bartonella acomydis]|uniref:Uncharacterized protein n=1 Tax=Bartonella acomydis TaxID=686234 RepID=A0ABP9MW59_9HYPH